MSDTYTKLFSSITESTVWGEPYSTRIVWVALLAMADAKGLIYGSIPGIARRANVTLQEAELALQSFMSPDAYSRTKDEDGRRIEEVDGGWRLINHAKYSAIRSAEERRGYKREWDRTHRPSGHERAQSDRSQGAETEIAVRQQSEKVRQNPSNPTAPTPLDLDLDLKEQDQDQTLLRQNRREREPKMPDRFAEFIAEYPCRKGKAAAMAKWKARNLDAIADQIIADVKARKQRDRQWLEGFVPHASTYVNGRGWEDDIEVARPKLVSNGGYVPMAGEV